MESDVAVFPVVQKENRRQMMMSRDGDSCLLGEAS